MKETRILVVDDEQEIADLLELYLISDGYQVVKSSDALEGLAIMEREKIDLVLLDIMMPKMDGLEMCRRIREKHNVPIIMVSAKTQELDKIVGLTTGADDYVTKPFNVEILILRMRKLIDLSKKRKAKSLIDPEPSEIAITSLDEKLVENAIKYVEANIGRCDLSVEELSRGLGMSRVHLYKKLLQITGKTPIEFIRVIRLKRAAQMLRESQQNVSEIAYQLGFNNPKYFSKYFKDEFGVLPSVYQEREGR